MENTIGERIGILLDALEIKKVRFAQRLNIDQSYVSQLVSANAILATGRWRISAGNSMFRNYGCAPGREKCFQSFRKTQISSGF